MSMKSKIKERIMINNLKRVSHRYDDINIRKMINDLGVDLRDQYTMQAEMTDYTMRKMETQQAFQISFTLRAVDYLSDKGIVSDDMRLSLVDIGDSAGNHLKYLRHKLENKYTDIETVSVNLDPVAVEKIRRRGGTAVLCRAEDYKPDVPVSLYLTYEMVEHLHNPALFFHNMAMANNGQYMVMSVPYVKNSRVSCLYIDDGKQDKVYAEGVHIFELSPTDWKRLVMHSGWRVIDSEIYCQYPVNSLFTPFYRWLWKRSDFEGFLALFLERDISQANRYQDWE